MTPDPHPSLHPAIRALTQAAHSTEAAPCSAEDLADRLKSLSSLDPASPVTLLGALWDVLDALAESLSGIDDLDVDQRHLVAVWLERAGGHLGAVGEALDRARAATGRWA